METLSSISGASWWSERRRSSRRSYPWCFSPEVAGAAEAISNDTVRYVSLDNVKRITRPQLKRLTGTEGATTVTAGLSSVCVWEGSSAITGEIGSTLISELEARLSMGSGLLASTVSTSGALD